MFEIPPAVGPLRLELFGIQVPPTKKAREKAKEEGRTIKPNYHVPSFKNSKMLVAKDPKGRPLREPFLATKPEYQQWMEKAIQSLESQLLSIARTASGGIRLELSKLFAIVSLLPADDSVNDLPKGEWEVLPCQPGKEGAVIKIERLP